MKVRVRLFGGLAERAGARELTLDLPKGATAGDVRDAVAERHPHADQIIRQVSLAVNLQATGPGREVFEDDEVALLPPVAGGGDRPRVLVGLRSPPLPVDEALAAISSPRAGGTTLFLGTVRDHSDVFDEVGRLVYAAYTEMATEVLHAIVGEVTDRWPEVTGVALLHAVGDLPVGAHTVLVACSAPHREEAYAASRHALEELKQRVPIWKKEIGPDGSRWVGLHEHHS